MIEDRAPPARAAGARRGQTLGRLDDDRARVSARTGTFEHETIRGEKEQRLRDGYVGRAANPTEPRGGGTRCDLQEWCPRKGLEEVRFRVEKPKRTTWWT